MGKKNRERRKQKKRKKLVQERHKLSSRKQGGGHRIAPVFTNVPDPLGGLSGDERRAAIEQVASRGEEVYQESLNKLNDILSDNNPLLLLAVISTRALSVGVSPDTGVNKLDSDFELHQAHVELLQALALQKCPADLSPEVFGPDIVNAVWEALKDLSNSLPFRELTPTGEESLDGENGSVLVQRLMRGATQMVRNWGHRSQVKRIAHELYSSFDADLLAVRGFGITAVIDVFETLLRIVEERQSERYLAIREIFRKAGQDKHLLVKEYHKYIGADEAKTKEFSEQIGIDKMTLDDLRLILLSHNDLCLPELYSFKPSDLSQRLELDSQQIEGILNQYSLTWGALESYRTDHIFLSNPVWTKPIIKIGDSQYFCCLPGAFFSFVIPCLEALLEGSESMVADRRARYLEDKLAEILARRFPTSKTIRNFKWDEDGNKYETDLITFIDSFALIVECKSGKITPPALRGAPDRLKKRIQDLLIEPNIQSLRLKKRIELISINPDLVDPLRDQLPHDLAHVRIVVRVSVCLEDFGAIQSSLRQLEGTTWLPDGFEPCPTMNLADFETVFDILDHPVQILHYLLRRESLEGSVGYFADELDLLGLYLTTLLNVGELEADLILNLRGMSAKIDKYYNSLDAGIKLKKPKPKITPLFAAIFSQLETRRPSRWTEIGVALNMFSPDHQTRLARNLPKLEKSVRRARKLERHDNMLIFAPPRGSQYALAYVMYKIENADQRSEYIEHAATVALEPAHVNHAVVIAKNIDKSDLAYHTIVLAQ